MSMNSYYPLLETSVWISGRLIKIWFKILENGLLSIEIRYDSESYEQSPENIYNENKKNPMTEKKLFQHFEIKIFSYL
jgi:hypothetical protein